VAKRSPVECHRWLIVEHPRAGVAEPAMPVEPCRIAALQGDLPAADQSGSDVGNALYHLLIRPVGELQLDLVGEM
jgi:hypothetical protein